jgi:hypothetical protein
LIANVSAVLGIPEGETNIIEKPESFIFVKYFSQEDMKYVILKTNIESEMPQGNVARLEPNLAPNPSFEEGVTIPMGWTYYPDTNGTYI